MPSLNQFADGTWRIGFLLRICAHGTWDDNDDLHSRLLAGLFDAYPRGATEITANVPDPSYPLHPRVATARPRLAGTEPPPAGQRPGQQQAPLLTPGAEAR